MKTFFNSMFFLFMAQPCYSAVFDQIEPTIEFDRAAFVGFIRIEHVQYDIEGIRLTAKVRSALKGSEFGNKITFLMPSKIDLVEGHSNYLAILYLDSHEIDGGLRSSIYQSIFVDYCDNIDEKDCHLLAHRSSVFTQGNHLGTSELIGGFVVVNNGIHALINWHEARRQLLKRKAHGGTSCFLHNEKEDTQQSKGASKRE